MPDVQVSIPLHREDKMPDENTAEHAAASDRTAPINTQESMADRIARLKSGSGAAAGATEVQENTSTTAGSAVQDKTNPQRVIAGQPQGRVQDGSLGGERVRVAPTGVVPESNDVMLGDQSSRKDGPKDSTLKVDASRSPHDASSGGSRQDAAHEQVEALKAKADAAKTNPAFQPEAKARTI